MSEEKSPDGALEADTVKKSEPASEDRSKDENKHHEDKDNLPMSHSETAMLEDEEMPTYVSVSTTSKCEDSDGSTARQVDEALSPEKTRSPTTSEQGGAASVYVLSSGEESDPRYNDEDEEDYGDSDEHEHEHAMLDEEEEEEEEEEEDTEEEESGDDFEMNLFETASDSVGIKSRLKKHNKDKSLSLQDLGVCKNHVRESDIGKRHRYKHVESKVKRYINDIKEQNRYSLEKRLKDQEQTANKARPEIKDTDTEQSRSLAVTNNKIIKEYAERAIKDLEIEESYVENRQLYTMVHVMENGQNASNRKSNSKNIEIEMREKNSLNHEEKGEHFKRNGTMQINALNHTYYQPSLQKNAKIAAFNESLMNGHQQALTFFNLHTLSYEEYMQGGADFSQELQSNKNEQSEQHEDNDSENYREVVNIPENESNSIPYPLKIENVKSIRVMSEESKDNVEQLKFFKTNDENMKNQLSLLKAQLDQKTAQFNSLKDAYQSTLAENSSMKQKLEHLKLRLAKYEKEYQTPEKKIAAVQTDLAAEVPSDENEIVDTKQQPSNKVSTSSIGSTASSTNQWTESAGSSGISIKPPDLATILPSDDSILTTEDTPRKTVRPLSRAFITSSRILQTLSSITHGKTKSDMKSSPLILHSSKKKSNTNEENNSGKENDASIIAGSNAFTSNSASSSKKRKATEMLGNSTFLQPSKIPHTTAEPRKKSDVELESRNAENKRIVENHEEEKDEKVEDIELNGGRVKCYVYRDDENTEDRSFLIQAEEPRESDEVGCVRECGPYLLGNVEVRMSEVNGTINIWGKEVSHESIALEDEEEVEIELKTANNSRCPCPWQKTPHRKYNGSQIVCSTSKKSKVQPKYGEEHNCEYARLPERFNTNLHADFADNRLNSNCKKCTSVNQPIECSAHRRISSVHERSRSCCIHSTEFLDKECKCTCDYEKRINNNENSYFAKEKCCSETAHKCVLKNVTDIDNDCLEHIVNPISDGPKEGSCKHHVVYRRHSLHNPEGNLQSEVKCCNVLREAPHVCKSGNTSCQDNGLVHSCSPMNDDEGAMLLPPRGNSETPEIRQRRSNGKRVRGILMDLLKSCGDYRSSHASSSKRCSNGKETSCSVDCSPKVNVMPCSTPDTVYTNSQQQSTGRCCHTYARRIESQLEEFRVEMERVRSRSDAILNMLSMLHTVETN